MTEDAL